MKILIVSELVKAAEELRCRAGIGSADENKTKPIPELISDVALFSHKGSSLVHLSKGTQKFCRDLFSERKITIDTDDLIDDLALWERMREAGADMNEVMGLTPAMDTTLPIPLFLEVFRKAVGMVQPHDNFHERTWEVLDLFGWSPPDRLPTPKRKTTDFVERPVKEKNELSKRTKLEIVKAAVRFLSKKKDKKALKSEVFSFLFSLYEDTEISLSEAILERLFRSYLPYEYCKEHGLIFHRVDAESYQVEKCK